MEKEILDFIFQSGGIGLQFYNPEEYNNEGIVYTIIDSDEKYIDLQWEDDEEIYYNSEPWHVFLSHLESGFYVIKNMDFLCQTMGVDLDIDDVFGSLNENESSHIVGNIERLLQEWNWVVMPVSDITEEQFQELQLYLYSKGIYWQSGGDDVRSMPPDLGWIYIGRYPYYNGRPPHAQRATIGWTFYQDGIWRPEEDPSYAEDYRLWNPKYKIVSYYDIILDDDDLDMDDVFGSLNEGTYQPILNLRFDPPLRNEWELLEVMKVIQRNYDDVTWRSGGIPTNLPYLDQIWEDPSEGIWYITIGFFKSNPKNITYTSGDIDDPSISDEEHHMYKHLNGREWVRSHDFDADETSDMFGPLIETNEFDWVGDIIDDDANRFSKIPSYNHERYILRFSQPMLASDVMDLLKFLKEIGWDVGDNIVRDYNFDDLVEYSSNGTGYIHLRPNGKVTYADDVKLFSDYTDIKLDTVRQIWV
jgi:hypothetical protein